MPIYDIRRKNITEMTLFLCLGSTSTERMGASKHNLPTAAVEVSNTTLYYGCSGGILGQKRANIKQFPDFLSKSSKMLVCIEVGHRIYLSDQLRFTSDTRLSHYHMIIYHLNIAE